jgi:hypothetical protein
MNWPVFLFFYLFPALMCLAVCGGIYYGLPKRLRPMKLAIVVTIALLPVVNLMVAGCIVCIVLIDVVTRHVPWKPGP